MPETKRPTSSADALEAAEWRRAGRCTVNGCVEVARVGDSMAIRDSRRPDTVVLAPAREFGVFAQAIKDGQFDDLLG